MKCLVQRAEWIPNYVVSNQALSCFVNCGPQGHELSTSKHHTSAVITICNMFTVNVLQNEYDCKMRQYEWSSVVFFSFRSVECVRSHWPESANLSGENINSFCFQDIVRQEFVEFVKKKKGKHRNIRAALGKWGNVKRRQKNTWRLKSYSVNGAEWELN